MQINSINPYKILSFGKEKDDFQPVSDAMRTIFHENVEPKSRQRLLWKLSEVPDFYEASKNATKQDLLDIADYMEGRKTNILQMALDGDVLVVRKSKKGDADKRNLLSLKEFIKQNQNLPEGKKIKLLDFLKSHFVSQVEDDVLEMKFETKEYPKVMHYIKDKNATGDVRYARINDGAAAMKSRMSVLASGSPLDEDDLGIIFKEDIEESNGPKIKGFSYDVINPASVEDEYADEYPFVYRFIEENRDIPWEIRKSVEGLRKIPYFKNLTRNTYPKNLFIFSNVNLACDDMLTKMLKQEITLDVRNPKNGEYVKTPVIDIGKLLYGMKEGTIKEKQIDEIVKNHTLAFEFGSLYATMRDKVPFKDIKSIELERFGNNLGFVVKSASGEKYPDCLSDENEAIKKILAALDKLPFKKAILNLNSKE